MAIIYNTDLSKELKEGAKLQQLRDIIPSQLADKVVPVMEVNPKLLRRTNLIKSNIRSTSGNHSIYTSPATGQDVFLETFTISMIKDVICDAATGSFNVNITVDGATIDVFRLPIITLTAQSSSIVLTLPHPVKIDRNSSVLMTGTFAAGVCVRSLSCTGYIVDNINA